MIAGAVAVLLLAAAILAPADVRPVLVVVAFAAGVVLERRRHPSPGTVVPLRQAAREWPRRVTSSVGWPVLVAAGLLVAGAIVLVTLPWGGSKPTSSGGRGTRASSPLPRLSIVRTRLGETFRAGGAAFTVTRARDELWAQQIRQSDPGRGRHWLLLAVTARNLDREDFNPATLTYRLRGAGGLAVDPTFGGGTGPRALGTEGSLPRGATGQARLAFPIPASSHRLALLFEPKVNRSPQVRVALRRR